MKYNVTCAVCGDSLILTQHVRGYEDDMRWEHVGQHDPEPEFTLLGDRERTDEQTRS